MSRLQIIEVKDLTKTYGGLFSKTPTPAIQNINLTIHSGETWAIVGPNGAGKSTTLHCLMGLFRPDSGVIRIFNQMPKDPSARTKIGFQSESFHTYGFQTASEVLSYYLKLQFPNAQNINQRIDEILKKVGLDHVKKKK